MSVKFRFFSELLNLNVLSAQATKEVLQKLPVKLTNRGLDNTCCLKTDVLNIFKRQVLFSGYI